MSVEIERKYLVDIAQWRASGMDRTNAARFLQGYLSTEPVVRVRSTDEKAWITIKGPSVGIARPEFEYEIPLDDARELLLLCGARVIEKTRITCEFAGRTWEVDEFHGANEGLVTAEVELESEDSRVVKPTWVGADVSADPGYSNSALARRPFTTWT